MFRDAVLVAGKDLKIEWRSKVGIGQIVPFALVILLLFGFALDPDRELLSRAAPGLFWIGVLLSTLLAVQRSFAIEATDGTYESLRSSGLDPAGIFFGKAAAIAAQLVVLEVVLALGVIVLYDVQVTAAVILLCTFVLATIGLAAAGTIYGVFTTGGRGRETLLPLLFLPVVAPVLLAAARATESALDQAGENGWPWVQLLAVFAVLYSAIGTVAFGPLLEDA